MSYTGCCLNVVFTFMNVVRYFLEKGYAVIFLHRRHSLQPFVRHFQHKNLLDFLCMNGGQPTGVVPAEVHVFVCICCSV